MMSQKEIQKSIASFVPEFSGEDTHNRTNELTRFIGTANSIYDMLEKEEEKAIFNKLIQFRLTGDAYVRIMHRQIKNYEALKEALESMYLKTQSLEELESEFTTAQQNYGETIRNYGYRIIEKLERYKSGFMAKYTLKEIDKAYNTHLDETAVQIFKKGLNNIILRNKMATCRAKNVDEMIKETEITEKMLILATSTSPQQPQLHRELQLQTPAKQTPMILCNYCQKPNHTWDVCRNRTFKEAAARRNIPHNTNPSFNTHRYTQNSEFTDRNRNNYNPTQNMSRQQVPYPRQSQQFTYPRQSQQFQPKYCSHCKVTKGHTFEECRSKFLGTRPYNTQNNHYVPQETPTTQNYRESHIKPPNNASLEDQFSKMRINVINPQQQQCQPEQIPQSENSNGSSHV